VLYDHPDHHPNVSAAELAHIRSDPEDPPAQIPWSTLLRHRQTWAFAIAKFMTDPIWLLYLFWIPDFLNRNHGINLTTMGPPLVAIYLIADGGSIGGGWLSSALIKRGWSVNAGRKTAMLVCALAVVPMVFASGATDLWVAVALVSLAAAAHQGWSANVFTMTSDMFPRKAVGSVVGIGGTAGAIGGMLIAKLTGYILQATGSYLPVFLIAAFAYLAALGIVHLIVPRLEPAKL
jgi:ACS family hexuronate transporter-like MFS transporter